MLTSNGYVLDDKPTRLGALTAVPEGERGDRDALARRLDEEGYAFLPGLLSASMVEDFRAYYFAALAPAGLTQTSPATQRLDSATLRHTLFAEVVPGTIYAAFCRHPSIRGWFRWLLGSDVHLHRRKIIRHVRPGEVGVGVATQAHYDLLYLREGSEQVLSMWIPLGDCPVQRGGLTYLERSHLWVRAEEADRAERGQPKRPAASISADLPSLADAHDARWLTADYRAGDVVVHCAQIVHAALDNVDDTVRLSTDIRYQRADQAIDPRWQRDWHDRDGL